LGKIESRIEELETRSADPDFWKDRVVAEATMNEMSALRDVYRFWTDLEKNIKDASDKLELLLEWEKELGNEEPVRIHEMLDEIEKHVIALDATFRKQEVQSFLSGKHDQFSATLGVSAGAGGRDAEDWASLLLRMYTQYAQKRGWKITLLHEHRGEEGGVKNVTIEIVGAYAYGFLRFESGVHRLVRISPFDANKRRHTSFASVEVLPVLSEDLAKKIEIRQEDIEVVTSRSSGPGGQNVNRRETAVRIVHKPTGLVAECQSERLQGENRRRALELLAAKLIAMEEEKRREEALRLRGQKASTSWGNQIRSYVLHPYQLVKDHRTNVEVGNTEAVLDGGLDDFIEAQVHEFGERQVEVNS